MNFTAELPNGKTKDVWISSLPVGTIFCTRRTMKCANCGENSLKHKQIEGKLYCLEKHYGQCKQWQPLPLAYKVGKKYAICSGRGSPAICECGLKKKSHVCGHYYKPLSCELVSVMDEDEWIKKYVTADNDFSQRWANMIWLAEAKREGFETPDQLNDWIEKHYKGRPKMWRYEFKR